MNNGKKQKPRLDEEQEQVRVVVNANEEDFEEGLDEPVVNTTPAPAGALNADMQTFITSQIAFTTASFAKDIADLQTKVHDHDNRLIKLENIAAVAPMMEQKPADKNILDSTLDLTFGTAGRLLHGVVDTVSFLATTVVDVATLGRGKSSKPTS